MKTWRTKDGMEIPLNELTDSHLNNCISMLGRRLLETPYCLLCLAVEKYKRRLWGKNNGRINQSLNGTWRLK